MSDDAPIKASVQSVERAFELLYDAFAQEGSGLERIKGYVEDSGEGVPEEFAARLFGRFERGREGHGSGLGLAIARAYANAHGGDLVYASEGEGARFELTLPVEG